MFLYSAGTVAENSELLQAVAKISCEHGLWLAACVNQKAGVCCIANTGSTFSFTFPEVLVIFGRRGLFFAAETVRAVIITRKIIKRIGCKKIHHIVHHICCSPL